jgi:hypothetical protein
MSFLDRIRASLASNKVRGTTKTEADHIEIEHVEEPSVAETDVDPYRNPPSNEEIWSRPFKTDLPRLPKDRQEVYEIYGRPPEQPKTDSIAKYKVAKLSTVKGLPGRWNDSSGKLYVLEYLAPYLREALDRSGKLGVLNYILKMGAYNYRPIRHSPGAPLSFHSWAAAVDINSSDNKAVTKKGSFPAPFSKGWMKFYPHGVPYELVRCFTSVGFAWGGDWGYNGWVDVVKKHGVGYDDSLAPADWKKVTFVDPMHFELIDRRKK